MTHPEFSVFENKGQHTVYVRNFPLIYFLGEDSEAAAKHVAESLNTVLENARLDYRDLIWGEE